MEEVNLRQYMHGLAKGHYVSSVLCTVEPTRHSAGATLAFTHHHAHGDLGEGGDHGVYDAEAKQQLEELKLKYSDVFQEPSYPLRRGGDPVYAFRIPLKDQQKDPPRKKLYPLDADELAELKAQIEKFLASGRIVPSSSPYGAPILFAKKKDGGLWMCIDYR